MFHDTSSGHQQMVEISSTTEFNFPRNTTKDCSWLKVLVTALVYM